VVSKIIVKFFLFFLISSNTYAGEKGAHFIITADCVTSIEVKKSRFAGVWNLEISIDEDAAKKLYSLSSKNIGKKITTLDGNNIVVYEAVVMEPISKIFKISGIASEEMARKSKKSILESTGKCGEKKQ
jgi:preprotein translocase subunit SecD